MHGVELCGKFDRLIVEVCELVKKTAELVNKAGELVK